MVSVNYPNTCQSIDDAIYNLEQTIEVAANSLSDRVNSELNYLRNLNEELRDQAEIQLCDLQDEIDELTTELENKTNEYDILTDKMDDLQTRYEALESALIAADVTIPI